MSSVAVTIRFGSKEQEKTLISPNMFKAITIYGVLLLVCVATSAPLGFEDVDVDDENVRAVADLATRKLTQTSNDKYHYRLVRVLKAQKQNVEDTNYTLDIIVGRTTCERTSDYDTECEFQDNENTYKRCVVNVFKAVKGDHSYFGSRCRFISKNEI